jgi:enoyl-CoA hydratase/carnithine racemase
MSDDSFVLTDVIDGVGWLTLNEPARLNPVTRERIREIGTAAEAASANDDVAVVVITGAGRGFCSGADLGRVPQTQEGPREAQPASGSLLDAGPGLPGLWTLTAVRQPVIAMVNGAAVGYGAELALQADIRIAGESARMGFPFAQLGVVSDTGAGSWLMPRLIGWSRAADLLYSGRLIEADEGKELGLFNYVVPDAELREFTEGYARNLGKNSHWSLRTIKRMIFAGLNESKREHVLDQHFRFQERGDDVDQTAYRERFAR